MAKLKFLYLLIPMWGLDIAIQFISNQRVLTILESFLLGYCFCFTVAMILEYLESLLEYKRKIKDIDNYFKNEVEKDIQKIHQHMWVNSPSYRKYYQKELNNEGK
jgi:hypothetical protein